MAICIAFAALTFTLPTAPSKQIAELAEVGVIKASGRDISGSLSDMSDGEREELEDPARDERGAVYKLPYGGFCSVRVMELYSEFFLLNSTILDVTFGTGRGGGKSSTNNYSV